MLFATSTAFLFARSDVCLDDGNAICRKDFLGLVPYVSKNQRVAQAPGKGGHCQASLG
jgi:hypothetical protein